MRSRWGVFRSRYLRHTLRELPVIQEFREIDFTQADLWVLIELSLKTYFFEAVLGSLAVFAHSYLTSQDQGPSSRRRSELRRGW